MLIYIVDYYFILYVIFTHADDSLRTKAFIRVCLCVRTFVCVCPQHNSKPNNPKVFKLSIENDLEMS